MPVQVVDNYAPLIGRDMINILYDELFPAVRKAEAERVLNIFWDSWIEAIKRQQRISIPRIGELRPYYSKKGGFAGVTDTPLLYYKFCLLPALAWEVPIPAQRQYAYIRSVIQWLKRKYGVKANWPQSYSWVLPYYSGP